MNGPAPVVDHVIGGAEVAPAEGGRFETRDPHDDALLAAVAAGGVEDARRAVIAARVAFDDGPWPHLRAAPRDGVHLTSTPNLT